MTAAGLLGNLIFSLIGMAALGYGKRNSKFQTMGLGGLLMVYGYFVPNTAMLYLVGLSLTGALFIFRD